MQKSFTSIIGCRGYHIYMKTTWLKPEKSDELKLQIEDNNTFDNWAVGVLRLDGDVWATVGHIPIEISRHVYYFLKSGGKTSVKVHDTKLHRSPVALKGLEIFIEITFIINIEKIKILQRLKENIETNYTTETMEQSEKEEVQIAEDEEDTDIISETDSEISI